MKFFEQLCAAGTLSQKEGENPAADTTTTETTTVTDTSADTTDGSTDGSTNGSTDGSTDSSNAPTTAPTTDKPNSSILSSSYSFWVLALSLILVLCHW